MKMDENLTMREILTGHEHTRQRGTNMTTIDGFQHLKFSDIDHYTKALELAEKLGGEALTSFKSNFECLERICARQDKNAEVHPDCTRHSFYFRMYQKDGSLSIDGGIILHGVSNSFNIELCPKPGLYWSMHT
jgi:hypothetical protein